MSYYLGIDVGTTVMKAEVTDEEGRSISFAFAKYKTVQKKGDSVEQEAGEWWNKLKKVIEKVTRNIHPEDIKALSLSTQGGTVIPVDKYGRPLRKAILWLDTRAREESSRLNEELGENYWYFHSGKRIQPSSPLPKLLWLKKKEKKVFKNTYKFLQVPDYLNYKLTARFVTDVCNASYNSFFELKGRKWNEKILNEYGIDIQKLAEVKDSAVPIGRLTSQAANFLGLSPKTYVVTGAHDQTCASLGAGIHKEEELLLSMGTAWVLYSILSKARLSKNKIYTLYCHALLHQWAYFLAMNGSIVSDWFIQNFCEEEMRRSKREKISVYHLLLGNGDNIPSEVIFLPYLYGALAPHYLPSFKGLILGLSLKTTKQEIFQALMESLVFEARWNIEILKEEGFHIKEIRTAGGPSENKDLRQMIANILNIPVKQALSKESAVKGAALLAYIEMGGEKRFPAFGTDAIMFPDKDKEKLFSSKFSLYKQAFYQFKKLMH